MEHSFKFPVSHAENTQFERGLRAFFEYRDLASSRPPPVVAIKQRSRSLRLQALPRQNGIAPRLSGIE